MIRRALLVALAVAGCSPGETPAQQTAARLAKAEAAMEECKRSVGRLQLDELLAARRPQ